MPDSMRPVVLSVATFTDIEAIDGGDTIVVRFKAPDDREVAVLIPQQAFADLKSRLADTPLRPASHLR